MQSLSKFAQAQNVFIHDFIDVVKTCEKKLYKLYVDPVTNYCHVDGIFQTFLAIVHHSSLQQTMAFKRFTLTKMSALTKRMSI
jgi:hypothetical protein